MSRIKRDQFERFFGWLTHYFRIATRFEKTAWDYPAFVQLASTLTFFR